MTILIAGIGYSSEYKIEPVLGLQFGYPNIAEIHGGIYLGTNNIFNISSGPMAVISAGDAYSTLGIGFGGYEAGHSYCHGYRIEFNGGYIYADRMGMDKNQGVFGSKISFTPGFFGLNLGFMKGVKDNAIAVIWGINFLM